ncbi:MAG: alpha/beta hydrolase [Leptolyngbyaceae cyanobacterium SL_7_1]|nr:alpha/beta hydrolase [Leptolyngbyaceae cyanobacterium SL_7_1]
MSIPSPIAPEFLLFVQHGWADDNRAMLSLAQHLVTDTTPIIAPDLGFLETWIRITPLIAGVEAIALQQFTRYPDVPIRIVGHSMGGLIWLEVLSRHPEWWSKVHSLVLVASPVGGADLGRLIDPLNLGIGIAGDLGRNRTALAVAIAASIPTLMIAGDSDGGSDGIVPVVCTRFANAQFVCLSGIAHAAMRTHPKVIATIHEFWTGTANYEVVAADDMIQRLRAVPGMTDGHWRDFNRATIAMHLNTGGTLRVWINPLGIPHVFLASPGGECLYAGFVGWLHTNDLHQALADIRQVYGT